LAATSLTSLEVNSGGHPTCHLDERKVMADLMPPTKPSDAFERNAAQPDIQGDLMRHQ